MSCHPSSVCGYRKNQRVHDRRLGVVDDGTAERPLIVVAVPRRWHARLDLVELTTLNRPFFPRSHYALRATSSSLYGLGDDDACCNVVSDSDWMIRSRVFPVLRFTFFFDGCGCRSRCWVGPCALGVIQRSASAVVQLARPEEDIFRGLHHRDSRRSCSRCGRARYPHRRQSPRTVGVHRDVVGPGAITTEAQAAPAAPDTPSPCTGTASSSGHTRPAERSRSQEVRTTRRSTCATWRIYCWLLSSVQTTPARAAVHEATSVTRSPARAPRQSSVRRLHPLLQSPAAGSCFRYLRCSFPHPRTHSGSFRRRQRSVPSCVCRSHR